MIWRGFGIFVTASLLSVGVAGYLLCQTNTLAANGRWHSGKMLVDTELMGSEPFMTWTQSQARNHLHLNAWHGYQEVLSNVRVEPTEISWRFWLSPDGYFVLLLSRSKQHFSGIRISRREDLPTAVVAGDTNGKFNRLEAIEHPPISERTWHEATVMLVDGMATLHINGEKIATFVFTQNGPTNIGFRGAALPAMIDDVEVRGHDGELLLKDDFSNQEQLPQNALLILFVVMFLDLVIVYSCRFLGMPLNTVVSAIIAINVCGIAAVYPLWFMQYQVLAAKYPTAEQHQQVEDKWVATQREMLHADLYEEPPVASGQGDGRRRVVFVGTSQTHGTGASHPDESFVSRLRQKITNTAADAETFEVVNLAVPGDRAKGQLTAYKAFLKKNTSEVTVINLSVNDHAQSDFETNIRTLLKLNEAREIKTVLVQEAYSSESESELVEANHERLGRLASEFDVPIVTSHTFLAERLNTGFLWWDIVHPTSYGHSLIAEALWPTLREQLALSEQDQSSDP